MTLVIPRRKFLAGLVGLIAAPAVVKASSLMPVRTIPQILDVYGRSPAMDARPDLRAVFYCNRTIRQWIDAQAIAKGRNFADEMFRLIEVKPIPLF